VLARGQGKPTFNVDEHSLYVSMIYHF